MYLRKSRADEEAEARGEEETLKRHERILLALSRKMNIVISKIYREVVSGETIAERPEIQNLLRDVEQGLWKGVFVVEVERLARGDTIDQGIVAQTFKYSDTTIITPMKTYDPNDEFDEEYFEFGLFMSRREYKTINRRLQRGRISSVKEGKYVGNIPPFGYVRKKLEKDKGFTLEPHPEQAPVVKLIFELYTKGEKLSDGSFKRLGVSLIVRKLNDLKVPTAKGGDWVPATIQGILQNPVYIGKVRWNSRPMVKKMVEGKIVKSRPRAKPEDWILADGLHEAIIDDKTFELAQYYINQNPTHPVPRRYIVKNPLSGLIVCGKCGRKMVRRPHGDKYPDTLMCPVTSCDNISSQLSFVEDKLLKALEEWLKKYKLDLRGVEKNNNNENLETKLINKSLDSINKELETLKTQFNNLHDLLEQEVYSVDTFLERSKTLNERITITNKHKKELEVQLKTISAQHTAKEKVIPKIEKILELYHHLKTPSKKNELLKEVLDKVIYIKTVNGRWHGKPDDFTLELYPKLP
jgi:DNA invertase Pin-like site-specific DNA recombinase